MSARWGKNRKEWEARTASSPSKPVASPGKSARDVLRALRAQGRIDEATQLADALANGDVMRVRAIIGQV